MATGTAVVTEAPVTAAVSPATAPVGEASAAQMLETRTLKILSGGGHDDV
jgi:hypothetical protein